MNICLFSELPSASTRVWHTRAATAAHPLKFEVLSRRTFQFAKCFMAAQVRMWNDLPFTVFDIGTLDGLKGAVNRWLLPWVVFSSIFRGTGSCAVYKQCLTIYKQFCLSNLGVCCLCVSISVEQSWWPGIRWCVTGGFQEPSQCLFIGQAARSLFVSYWIPFLFFHSMGWYCGPGVDRLMGCWSLSPSQHCRLILIIIIIIYHLLSLHYMHTYQKY